MTLHIEDGKRMYECVLGTEYKKKELLFLDCLAQSVRQLAAKRTDVSPDEERLITHCMTELKRWRKKKKSIRS